MRHITTLFILGLLLPVAEAKEIPVSDPAALEAAILEAAPGDTIVMSDGEWRDAQIAFRGKGTAEQPITLRAGTPGKVVLNGKSKLLIAGEHLVVDGLHFQDGFVESGDVVAFREKDEEARDCRLTNTAIIDYNPPDSEADTKWVSLYGANNRVDHCHFRGKTNSGATLVVWVDATKPNDHRIDHNFFDARPPLGRNGGETIRVGTSKVSMSVSRTIVESNYFQNCDGEIEIVSNKSCENIYRNNTFVECEGALTLRHGNRCTVEGNFFFGNGKPATGGVRIIGEDHKVYNNHFSGLTGSSNKSAMAIMNGIPDSPLNGYFQVKNAIVAFNTFVDCEHNILLGAGASSRNRSLPPENCIFANNVIVSKGPAVEIDAEPVNAKWIGNFFLSAEGDTTREGVSSVDPQLVKDENGLWRPGPGSPVRDAAQGSFPFVFEDIDGQPRSGKLDAGCDEVSSAPVVRRPLASRDAGPSWMAAVRTP